MHSFKISNLKIFIICLIIGIFINIFSEYLKKASIKSLNLQSIAHKDLYRKWISSFNISLGRAPNSNNQIKTISEAQFLKENIRVFCAILCDSSYESSKSFNSKYDLINRDTGLSWARKCTKLVFYGDCIFRITGYTHVQLNGIESTSWTGYQKVLHDIYKNHNNYTWFLTAKENTFVIIENLRFYVSVLDTSENQYLGHSCTKWSLQYNCLEAGFVFNIRTLKSIMNQLSLGHCTESDSIMDIELGRCLGEIGINPVDTRDSGFHDRFLILNPERLLINNYMDTIFLPSKYRVLKGTDCCSDFVISFPYADKISQIIFDYMVYRLHPFGVNTMINANSKDSYTER